MKKNLSIILVFLPFFIMAQGLTEDQIPFFQNSDNDAEINVVDEDDDNDLTLDNDDFFPLDPAMAEPQLVIDTVKATDDAGLRSNTSSNANRNYGSDPAVQTKNDLRSFICKIPVPDERITKATFTLFTDSEDDDLAIFYVPFDWSEDTITYNTMNLNSAVLLGTTGTPMNGRYTYELPLNILPEGGGEITLWTYDPNDPNDNTESILTKEFEGDNPEDMMGDQAPTITYEYIQSMTERVIEDDLNEKRLFINGTQLPVGLKLSQAPTDTVYVPIASSDPNVSEMTGDEVLKFTPTNWNVIQQVNFVPVSPGEFTVNIRPLHSNDPFFNGINPFDLTEYFIQPTDVPNLTGWTVTTGQSLETTITPISDVGSQSYIFKILEGPSGFNVIENSGNLSFTPLSNQIGVHDVTIEITDEFGFASLFFTTVTVLDGGVTDPVGTYVDLGAPDDINADGTPQHPFNDLEDGVAEAVASGFGNVFLRGGEFDLKAIVFISDSASASNPLVIGPLPGENVKINFENTSAIYFTETSRNMVLKDIEIDGGTDEVDFWCIVGQSVFYDSSVPRGGGIAVLLEGEHLTMQDCYVHDCYQKAAEIRGRYINVHGNIIRSIATTSISGGHGIMRQQKGREFFDDDDPTLYRWDIKDNLLFNVEQRIYSWVPAKGFMEMVIDEGKPILIDDPKDTDGMQEAMKARITNNVIAFGSIDHIRLKSTPNLEVSNNSIYSESENGDGITDKIGDTSTPQFTNFICENNVVQTSIGSFAFNITTGINQATAAGGVPVVNNNKGAGGLLRPTGYPGLDDLGNIDLFVDANNGDFTLNPSAGLPSTVGVSPANLVALDDKALKFGVNIQWDGWVNDDLKLSQSILDNIPGLNDGIPNNERVFTDYGNLNEDPAHGWVIDYTVTPEFQALSGATPTMEFRLNEKYVDWYFEVNDVYKSSTGTDYDRIRWGCSVLKQDQVFLDNWLTHVQITSDTTNTLIEAKGQYVSLNGDILIDFHNYTPVPVTSFDLIIADSIDSQNTGDLFDRVIFKGTTPDTFSLEIVPVVGGYKALRLTIEDPSGCQLTVTSRDDSGAGTLRDAILCAVDGDTIRFDQSLVSDTIFISSGILNVDKAITFCNDLTGSITISSVLPQVAGLPTLISIDNTVGMVTFKNIDMIGGFGPEASVILNNGNLTLDNVNMSNSDLGINAVIKNSPGSTLDIINEVSIDK